MKKYKNIFLTVFLSLTFSYIIYFGFTSNYSKDVFSRQSFSHQYDHGIYKYRILSKQLLLKIDDVLQNHFSDNKTSDRILVLDKTGTNRFYYSYYLLNTFFLLLLAVVLVLLFESDRIFMINKNETSLLLSLLVILIAVTQYVIVPYDISFYFFHLLTIYIFFSYFNTFPKFSLVSICALIILSTLNRESSALTVGFLIMILLLKNGLNKKFILNAVFFLASFLITYIALRFYFKGNESMFMEGNKIRDNVTGFANLTGIFFGLLCFYLSISIANSKENKYIIILYHIVSLPYITTCFISGILFETRLYIPLFLSSVLLSKIDTSKFRINISEYRQRILSPKG